MDYVSKVTSIATRIPFSYLNMLTKSLDGNCGSVLDIGCGQGGVMTILKKHRHNDLFSIGVDVYLPYIKECKLNKTHDELFACDVRYLPFRPSSFDAVICCEVIEHLEKKDGLNLLSYIEQMARKKVIVTTPIGFKETEDKNVFQVHKSGWRPKDFTARGYLVRGQGVSFSDAINHSFLPKHHVRTFGPNGSIDNYPKFVKKFFIIGTLLSLAFFFLRPISYFIPRLAFHIFCTKNVEPVRNID